MWSPEEGRKNPVRPVANGGHLHLVPDYNPPSFPMSSSAGLSSYSSLFASGLHPSGRLQAATGKDVYAYPFERIPYGLKDIPTNVNTRRPSADTESTASRRSSLPTFASGRRMGQNNSYYPPTQQPAAVASPSAIAFTPSILLRSETTATKRSDFKSFLSMDANDPTQQPLVPPLPTNLQNHTSPPRVSQNKRSHGRAVSANSSTWAPSMLQSPNTSNYSSNFDSDRHSIAGPFGGTPPISEAHSMRRSISAPSREDHKSTSLQRTESVHYSDKPPRLEIRLCPKASRISFDPSSPDVTRVASLVSEAPPTPSPSIPARPEYNPRVRSSLPAGSVISPLPPVPPRSLQRNMSVASASTFFSSTPSQRSAVRRVRRDEALARLEGNYYDPAPEVQASGSFMPFESDEEEEEESEVDRRSRQDILSSRAKSPPPPIIKPPSPLRYRNNEQRRFVEIEATESLFELALSTIAEVPIPSIPQKDTGLSLDNRGPMISVHESMWPSFDEEDEENVTPSASHNHHMVPMTSRTPLAVSPFSSHTNLTTHTANKSSTSLASFTPFSSTDFNRTRTGSIHQHTTHGTGSGSPYATSAGSKPNSGPGSIVTKDSLSIRSNDAASDESVAPGSVVPGIGSIIMNMDPGSRRGQDRARDRSGSTSRVTPHYLKATAVAPLSPALNDAPRGIWMHGPSSAVAPTTPKTNKSSKHREKRGPNAKSKDAKGKDVKIRYETYLDMSGDEKYVRDGARKRRWLFGK